MKLMLTWMDCLFTVEVDDLINHGYEFNGVVYEFGIRNFILDAPARSFVKCCILHTGYGACEKCTVVAIHEEGRINFFNLGVECRPRTDESFANQDDRLHHNGISPLQLIGVGMVRQFRLDSMHLVHKGVFLRFIEALLTWEGYWSPSPNDYKCYDNKAFVSRFQLP